MNFPPNIYEVLEKQIYLKTFLVHLQIRDESDGWVWVFFVSENGSNRLWLNEKFSYIFYSYPNLKQFLPSFFKVSQHFFLHFTLKKNLHKNGPKLRRRKMERKKIPLAFKTHYSRELPLNQKKTQLISANKSTTIHKSMDFKNYFCIMKMK